MAKQLVVKIVGDTSSFEESCKRASAQLDGFGSKLGHVAKTAALLGGAAALGGLAVVLDKSIKAAMEGQAAQAALDTALKATHQSVTAMTPALEAANEAARKLGFTDADSETALSRLEIATGNTTKAIKDEGVAMDIARFKHVALSAAGQMLAQAMTGSQRAAKQLGLTVTPLTTNLDALKASHEDLTTATGKLDEAHAKLLDKMATGQAVIAAVTEKVHGQAQAYAETAAGGMATFSAQIDFMEQKLGNALLPTLVNVMTWVNAHWPQIQAVFQSVFQGIGQAIDFLKPYFADLVQASEQVVDRVRADWPQIHATIENVMNAVKEIITGVVNVAEAVWSKFGSAITDIAKRTFAQIGPIIKDALSIAIGVVQALGDLLHGRWSKMFDDLGKVVSSAFDAVKRIIVTAAKDVGEAALAIGKAIIQGIVTGLGDIASSVGNHISNGISGALNSVKGHLGIHSPSTVFAEQIGEPMAHGVIEGWKIGIAPLSGIISDNLDSLVVAANKKLVAGIGNLKQYTIPSLLTDATNFVNQQATAAANADTISQYQAAILTGQAGINHSGSPDDRGGFAMAAGGFGRVTKPTWFLAGEAGAEDVAFSGANKSFGGGSGGGRTVELHLHIGTMIGGQPQQVANDLKPYLDRAISL